MHTRCPRRISHVKTRLDWSRAGLGALAVLLTGAVAVGAGQLVAGLTSPGASPVVAVGQLQIDFTPPALKNFAIRAFGSHDKLVLVSGILLVLALFAAALGALAMRRLRYGLAGLAVFAVIGVIAAATRPAASAADVLPALAAVAAAMIAMPVLVRAASAARPAGSTSPPQPSPAPGNTACGGSAGCGSVVELSPNGSGGWTFTDVSKQTGAGVGASDMGIGFSDYNHTGRWSFYLSNISSNVFLQQQAGGTFSPVQTDGPLGAHAARSTIPTATGTAQQFAWGAALYDFNNDGWEDIYIGGGAMNPTAPNQPNGLLLNNQDGTFLDLSILSGTEGANEMMPGVVYADFNNDGFMDIFEAGMMGAMHLYMNNGISQGNPNHWLEVKLVGTTSNRDAVGARLVASVGGVNLLRAVVNTGYQGNSTLVRHFGLGSATQVDTLTIYWPSGKTQTLTNVAANQKIVVTEQ